MWIRALKGPEKMREYPVIKRSLLFLPIFLFLLSCGSPEKKAVSAVDGAAIRQDPPVDAVSTDVPPAPDGDEPPAEDIPVFDNGEIVPESELLCRALELPSDTVLRINDTLELTFSLSRDGGEGPDNPLLLTLEIWKMVPDLPDTFPLGQKFVIVAVPDKGGDPLVCLFYSEEEISFFSGSGRSMVFDNYVLRNESGYFIDGNEEYPFLPGPPEPGSYTVNIFIVFDDNTCILGKPVNIVLWE